MTTVEKQGNDLVIRLPRTLARKAHFKAGMKLDVYVLGDQIQLRPVGALRRRSKYKLSDLLKRMKGPSPHKRVFDDPAVGRELI